MGLFDKFKKSVGDAVKTTSEAIGFDKLKDGLEKTRNNFVDSIKLVLGAGRKIDEELLEEIEDILLSADIGVTSTESIIDSVRERVKKERHENAEDVYVMLQEEIEKMLIKSPSAVNDKTYSVDENNKPHTILVIGVNGTGKTTTIGKLAYNYKQAGKEVMIAAADTYRAAANEQLEIWAERAGVGIIQQKRGSDPGAVVYDSMNSAKSKGYEVVIVDTAGRLHNKQHLMVELNKMTRVIQKHKPEGPDEVFLILDATTGQNAIQQAKEFSKVANITGIVLTKLDGTAKGGVVIPIAAELELPVRYIGVGEKIDDLQVFEPDKFIAALFQSNGAEETEQEAGESG